MAFAGSSEIKVGAEVSSGIGECPLPIGASAPILSPAVVMDASPQEIAAIVKSIRFPKYVVIDGTGFTNPTDLMDPALGPPLSCAEK